MKAWDTLHDLKRRLSVVSANWKNSLQPAENALGAKSCIERYKIWKTKAIIALIHSTASSPNKKQDVNDSFSFQLLKPKDAFGIQLLFQHGSQIGTS